MGKCPAPSWDGAQGGLDLTGARRTEHSSAPSPSEWERSAEGSKVCVQGLPMARGEQVVMDSPASVLAQERQTRRTGWERQGVAEDGGHCPTGVTSSLIPQENRSL